DDSSDDEDTKAAPAKRKLPASKAASTPSKKQKTESSSSDSSSSSDESSDESEDEDEVAKEKARRVEAAAAAAAWTPKKIEAPTLGEQGQKGVPFQRVDGEYWSTQIVDETLRDNSYAATFGEDGVGSKANTVLLKVRGKDFTREKNKKKRSTYLCGAIDLGSNSFKYTD
ncbi:hypothetical protein DYB28_008119, partial [Aphanomyces astaci]